MPQYSFLPVNFAVVVLHLAADGFSKENAWDFPVSVLPDGEVMNEGIVEIVKERYLRAYVRTVGREPRGRSEHEAEHLANVVWAPRNWVLGRES